jgi:serine/threonine-protein kinase HipA
MDDAGRWTLAPAYDLTFSFGPGGEQSMLVMGEGKSPGVAHLSALGTKHGLRSTGAIIDRVREATARWTVHAEAAGVARPSASKVGKAIAAVATSGTATPAQARTAKPSRTGRARKAMPR